MSDTNTNTYIEIPEDFDLDAALAEQKAEDERRKKRNALIKAAMEKRQAEDMAALTPFLDRAKAVKDAINESDAAKDVEKYSTLLKNAKDALKLLWDGDPEDEDFPGGTAELNAIVSECEEELGDRLAGVLKDTIAGKTTKRRSNGGGGKGKKTTGIEEAAGFVSPCGNVTLDSEGYPTVGGERVTWAAACGAVTDLCGMQAAEDSDHEKDEGRTGIAIKGNSAKRVFESYMSKARA